MSVNTSAGGFAVFGKLHDALAWPVGAAWPEDRPLAHWQHEAAAALRAPPVRTVYGTLLNHRAALAALGDAVHEPPYKAPPQAPVLYIKPRNTFAGYGDAVPVPEGVDALEVAPHGEQLNAGDVVLGGSFTRPTVAQAGDTFHADYGPLGTVTSRFV